MVSPQAALQKIPGHLARLPTRRRSLAEMEGGQLEVLAGQKTGSQRATSISLHTPM